MANKVKSHLGATQAPGLELPATIDISTATAGPALTLDGSETPAEKVSRVANARMGKRPHAGVTLKGPSEFRVMGLSGREALRLSADRAEELVGGGSTGSHTHEQGDMANRWDHGAIMQTVAAGAHAAGLPTPFALLLGGAVMVPKEYYYDLHPSPSDMGIMGEVVRATFHNGGYVSLMGAIYGDGALFANIQGRF